MGHALEVETRVVVNEEFITTEETVVTNGEMVVTTSQEVYTHETENRFYHTPSGSNRLGRHHARPRAKASKVKVKQESRPEVRVVEFRRNAGQTAHARRLACAS